MFDLVALDFVFTRNGLVCIFGCRATDDAVSGWALRDVQVDPGRRCTARYQHDDGPCAADDTCLLQLPTPDQLLDIPDIRYRHAAADLYRRRHPPSIALAYATPPPARYPPGYGAPLMPPEPACVLLDDPARLPPRAPVYGGPPPAADYGAPGPAGGLCYNGLNSSSADMLLRHDTVRRLRL